MTKEEKKNYFIYTDANGNKTECRILFTFECDKNKKNYIVYTDDTLDDDGKLRTYASTFEKDKKECELGPVKTEEEWKMIEGILANLTKEGMK